jgi:hypothetical protein
VKNEDLTPRIFLASFHSHTIFTELRKSYL